MPKIGSDEPTIEESSDIEEHFYDADLDDLNTFQMDDNLEITDRMPISRETSQIPMAMVQENVDSDQPLLRRSLRTTKGKLPERFMMSIGSNESEPKTFQDVMKRDDKEMWLEAMKEELKSLHDNNTWELGNLPDNRKAIGCKWVFKLKRDASGKVVKYKARLVAQGFSQRYGVDYDEVFAPVVRQSTLRMFLTLSGQNDMTVKQYDIKTAFLYGELNEEVYMKQPIGFETSNGKICKLKKAYTDLNNLPDVGMKSYAKFF